MNGYIGQFVFYVLFHLVSLFSLHCSFRTRQRERRTPSRRPDQLRRRKQRHPDARGVLGGAHGHHADPSDTGSAARPAQQRLADAATLRVRPESRAGRAVPSREVSAISFLFSSILLSLFVCLFVFSFFLTSFIHQFEVNIRNYSDHGPTTNGHSSSP